MAEEIPDRVGHCGCGALILRGKAPTEEEPLEGAEERELLEGAELEEEILEGAELEEEPLEGAEEDASDELAGRHAGSAP